MIAPMPSAQKSNRRPYSATCCFFILQYPLAGQIRSLQYKEFVSARYGGDEEDRTLDLTDANRTLSQLSYAPMAEIIITSAARIVNTKS